MGDRGISLGGALSIAFSHSGNYILHKRKLEIRRGDRAPGAHVGARE